MGEGVVSMLRAEEKHALCWGLFLVMEEGITLLCETHREVLHGEVCGFSATEVALPFCLAPRDLKKEKYFLNCSWPIIHRIKNNAGESGNLGAASFHF